MTKALRMFNYITHVKDQELELQKCRMSSNEPEWCVQESVDDILTALSGLVSKMILIIQSCIYLIQECKSSDGV